MKKKRLCDLKIRTQKLKTKTRNVQNKCEKKFFIMLTFTIMNMKRTWQGYGVKSCLKLVLK
jgi:hypothetical protein